MISKSIRSTAKIEGIILSFDVP